MEIQLWLINTVTQQTLHYDIHLKTQISTISQSGWEKPKKRPSSLSVLLQLVPNVHVQHQVHANTRFTCYSWKAFIFLKHENNSTRINKVVLLLVLLFKTCAICVSDYEGSSGKRQFSTNVGRTFDWHRSDSHSTSSTEVQWDEDGRANGQIRVTDQWSSTVSACWEHTGQAPMSCCLNEGSNNICTFVFFCSFCGVTPLLCPDKRWSHVDSKSHDWLGARHSNGCISWTLAYCICPSWTFLFKRGRQR